MSLAKIHDTQTLKVKSIQYTRNKQLKIQTKTHNVYSHTEKGTIKECNQQDNFCKKVYYKLLKRL
jgi:hypothetical protein